MKKRFDLSQLEWKLSGWTPHLWRMNQTMEVGASPNAEVPSIPARVPGSVQLALKEAGILPDWNVGLNYRQCEWVENRHWVYETVLPNEWIEQNSGKTYRLNCRGLDYCGSVFVNSQLVSEFCGSHVPYVFDITPYLGEENNVIRIVFETPPRWLGQFGYTSRMKEWKPRFNYTWDWVPRLVQIGIWDSVFIEVTDGEEIQDFRCVTDADPETGAGILTIKGRVTASDDAVIEVVLSKDDAVIKQESLSVPSFNRNGVSWKDLPVDLWWPNLQGDQPLYTLTFQLVNKNGGQLDSITRRVGFKNVTWAPCEGLPPEAYHNICVVNGRPVFLQGINWVPLLPNFADVREEDYRKRIEQYKDLGLNILRVWGGAILEKECFYDLCDELGLMVWQEFPQSSSGLDNWPVENEESIEEMAAIAESYIVRRQHHVSLTIWCGGNELQGSFDGRKEGGGKPVDFTHPMIARLKKVVAENDPTRRFLPTSPSGPVFGASAENFGKGIHWHVHGPWRWHGNLDGWNEYWARDDAGLRSETGAPGASSAEIIRKYAGEYDPMPISHENPLWRRTSVWWLENDQFKAEMGREPRSLEEYVEWNQERQKQALCTALKACKDRFPACGGFIIWMGHDCFPCTANTAIIDFEGNLKPAAAALRDIFRR